MATTTTTMPTSSMPFSVLTSSNDNNEDFLNQLRNHLTQIETNVQETFKKIQQRKPYVPLATNINSNDPQIRNQFFDVLKNMAIKNNLPFDEPFFRQQFLAKQDSSSSPIIDVLRDKPLMITDTNDQHLSPVNNTRRSQFAPVLSSTPVHQTSPITPIPVDLSLATSSAAPVLTINSTDLPAVPPSAIVPQRANLARTVGRPPRIPRGESVPRQKKTASPIKEQQDETILTKEIHITSKRRIKSKQQIIEDNIEVIIEQENEILSDIIKQVQTTPLRGRKKKIIQENNNHIPELEPPPPPPVLFVPENEILPKKTRAGRSKAKKDDEEEVKPIRTTSVRSRKKQQEEVEEKIPSPPPKKTARNKKLVEPVVNTEEILSIPKVRATPSRGKKKSPLEIPEPIIPSTPKKTTTTTKSKKRKDNEETNENPIEIIQPPSPKRRGGRNTKSKNSSPVETIPTPPLIEQEQQSVSTRSSRRRKKDIEIPIEKQEDIVLNKKTRTGRGKKTNQPINTDNPVTVVDVVMTSVTVSAPVPKSLSMDSLVTKPPRPPIARKKKSIAMPPISQMSPTTPSSTQRIQSTSPINDKPLLPLPVPKNASRRRQQQRQIINSPKRIEDGTLETLSSITRNQKRTNSSAITTPKRVRRDNLIVATVPGTPGKKRNKCTCQKRRNRICDICATAIDA